MLATVTEPSVLTNSTWGIDTKLVPAIVIVVAVAGAIVCDVFVTVGFVSYASTQVNWLVALPFVASTCPFVPTLVGNINL